MNMTIELLNDKQQKKVTLHYKDLRPWMMRKYSRAVWIFAGTSGEVEFDGKRFNALERGPRGGKKVKKTWKPPGCPFMPC